MQSVFDRNVVMRRISVYISMGSLIYLTTIIFFPLSPRVLAVRWARYVW